VCDSHLGDGGHFPLASTSLVLPWKVETVQLGSTHQPVLVLLVPVLLPVPVLSVD
jgi:hypothetical protein